MARTKIVCTIGPASSSAETIRGLIRAGMDVARINFSHGDRDVHARTISKVRRVAASEGVVVAVMADLQGPKLRVGDLEGGSVSLKEGDSVRLTAQPTSGSSAEIPVPHPEVLRSLRPRQVVLLNDGSLKLVVERADEDGLVCRVIVGGPLASRKGINVPGVELGLSSLTPKDQEDARFVLRQGVDFIAQSFVRSAADVCELRRFLRENGGNSLIIAKIEKAEALTVFDEILREADGIMVARGDLGVETPAVEVPFHQKNIIRACNRTGKPVITATQMLQSMMVHPQPTRAESSDVVNAILDGTDAVMLSGETAVGRYVVEAARMMEAISTNAEAHMTVGWLGRSSSAEHLGTAESISAAAVNIAEEVGAKAIVAATMSGMTARMVARHRPSVPIIAVTPNEATLHHLTLVWGVVAIAVPEFRSTDEMVQTMVRAVTEEALAERGDPVVLMAGIPFGSGATTNMLKVHVVGESGSI